MNSLHGSPKSAGRARPLVVVLLFLLTLLPLASFAGEVDWSTDIGKSLARAKAERKGLFIDFWATWCVPCRRLDTLVYSDSKVEQVLTNFVTLKIDQDAQPVFSQRHSVESLPTLLWLDPNGEEIARQVGLISVQRMVELSTRVADGLSVLQQGTSADASEAQIDAAARYLNSVGNTERSVTLLKKAIKSTGAEALELTLAETQLLAGQVKDGQKGLLRLSNSAKDAEIKKRAADALDRLLTAEK